MLSIFRAARASRRVPSWTTTWTRPSMAVMLPNWAISRFSINATRRSACAKASRNPLHSMVLPDFTHDFSPAAKELEPTRLRVIITGATATQPQSSARCGMRRFFLSPWTGKLHGC